MTDEVVVLVEVKCARPLFGYRLGDPEALDDVRAKLGEVRAQIERTAGLIRIVTHLSGRFLTTGRSAD